MLVFYSTPNDPYEKKKNIEMKISLRFRHLVA